VTLLLCGPDLSGPTTYRSRFHKQVHLCIDSSPLLLPNPRLGLFRGAYKTFLSCCVRPATGTMRYLAVALDSGG